MRFRLATRQSKLALTQSQWVADQIQAVFPTATIELVKVITAGDREQKRPTQSIGGKGVFVSEVSAMLAREEADLAVHSLKDIPSTHESPAIGTLYIPEREDAMDVLITRDGIALDDFSAGAKIGTSSARRASQLRAIRNDLNYVALRGNVDTRIRKLNEGAYDGIVLAAAGLRRLGILQSLSHIRLTPQHCVPSAGQGALAIETQTKNDELLEALKKVHHPASARAVLAERKIAALLGADCYSALGAHLWIEEQQIRVRAVVADPDSDAMIRSGCDMWHGDDPQDADFDHLAEAVAEELIDQGARELLIGATARALAREQQRREHSN